MATPERRTLRLADIDFGVAIRGDRVVLSFVGKRADVEIPVSVDRAERIAVMIAEAVRSARSGPLGTDSLGKPPP